MLNFFTYLLVGMSIYIQYYIKGESQFIFQEHLQLPLLYKLTNEGNNDKNYLNILLVGEIEVDNRSCIEQTCIYCGSVGVCSQAAKDFAGSFQ